MASPVDESQKYQLPSPVDASQRSPFPSSFYFTVESLSIDQQPTWIIPVVQNTSKVRKNSLLGNRRTQEHALLFRDLIKSLSIYSLATSISPLVSLVLAPFLTHTLSPVAYGALAVLNTTIALMTGLTQLGLGSAFFRAYSWDYRSRRDQLNTLSTTVVLLSLVSIPMTIIVILAAPTLAVLLFNSVDLAGPVRLAALVILTQNLTVPGLAWLRADSRAMFYSILSIANLLFTLVATIVLIGPLRMGLSGSLLAIGGGYAIIVVCTLPVSLLHAGLRLRLDITRNLLSFGLPLTASVVSVWVLQLSDRYLLSRLGSLAQTANYAVAYSLGGILAAVLLGPFSLAWPAAMYKIAKRDDAAYIFRLVFRWYFIVLLFTSFGLLILAIAILHLFFPPVYAVAAPLIPVITAGIMFYGLYNVLSVGISIRRKTWFAFISLTLAAIVNVVLNVILIPIYGSMGAAVSTLLAYLLLALIVYIVNQRIYPIPFEIGLFSLALFIGVVLYMASYIVSLSQASSISWGIDVCALGLYGVCLAFLGKPPVHRLKKYIQFAHKKGLFGL